MDWIDYSYELVWDQLPPTPRELRNSKSSNDNDKFVTKAVAEMLKEGRGKQRVFYLFTD